MSNDLSLAQTHAFAARPHADGPGDGVPGRWRVRRAAERRDRRRRRAPRHPRIRPPRSSAGSLSRPLGAAGEQSPAREAAPRTIDLDHHVDRSIRALAGAALRGGWAWTREICGRDDAAGKAGRRRREKMMEQRELEELKGRVLCAAVLEKAGFAIDLKESTRTRRQASARQRHHHRDP